MMRDATPRKHFANRRTTQGVVAQSSEESAFQWIVKGGAFGLSSKSFMRDVGIWILVNMSTERSGCREYHTRFTVSCSLFSHLFREARCSGPHVLSSSSGPEDASWHPTSDS